MLMSRSCRGTANRACAWVENSETASSGSPVDRRIVERLIHFRRQIRLGFRQPVWTFTWSALMSVSASNVTVSCVVLSLAFVDCMYSMLSTPFICCSIGVATLVHRDRVCARICRREIICGGTISGNCARGGAQRHGRRR